MSVQTRNAAKTVKPCVPNELRRLQELFDFR